MATYEEVINGNINSLKELKELVKSFKDELATAKEGTQEWANACEGLAVAQERVDKINKAAKGSLDGYNSSAKDSINTLKEQIKQLNAQRNAMDMNSQEYADATARLKEMNDRLRQSGVAAGDMKANVGNYAASLASGFDGIKGAVSSASSQMITAIGGLGQSLGGLTSTVGTVTTSMGGLAAASGGVGIALAAVAAVIAAFKEGVQSSEENTQKFRTALIPVKTVLVMLQRGIQEVTSKVLDWVIALRENEKFTNAVKVALTAVVSVYNLFKQRIIDTIEVYKKWYNNLKEVGEKIETIFKPVIDTFNKVFKAVKDELRPVIEWIIEKYNWIAKSDLGKILGLKTIKDYKDAWKDATETVEKFTEDYVKTEKQVTKATEAINKRDAAIRGAMQAAAKLEGEVALKDLEIAEERNKEIKDYDKILQLINEKTELQVKLANANVAAKAAQLAAIRAENKLSGSNTAALNAEASAAADLTRAQNAATQARVQGEQEMRRILQAKRSEEYTKSLNALNASLKNFEAQYTETIANLDKPIAPESNEETFESLNAYYDAVKAQYQAEYEAYSVMTEQKIAALEAFMEVQKKYGKDTAQQEAEINKLRANQTKEYKKMSAQQEASDKQRTKSLKANLNSQLSAYSNLFGSVSELFEENTIAYKMTATAKALIDTFLAANAVLAQQPGGYITKAIAMAATIAAGIANVIAIWKTDPKSPSVSTSTVQTATSTPRVDETPYTYAQTVQTAAAEETINQAMEPTKVYVLESDITEAQERSKVRVAESEW